MVKFILKFIKSCIAKRYDDYWRGSFCPTYLWTAGLPRSNVTSTIFNVEGMLTK